MPPFAYRDGTLHGGSAALSGLAERHGTPLYVYNLDAIDDAWDAYERALRGVPHLICAAVKANGNLAILRRLARRGSGFDVVSGGELERVLRAGGSAAKTVFSGVGKTAEEMDAALRAGILLFNVESEPELELLAERAARLRRRARFAMRVNPNVAAPTHASIATGQRGHKFGVAPALALKLMRRSRTSATIDAGERWLEPAGLSCHIGSQLLDLAPIERAVSRLAALVGEYEKSGGRLRYFDVGGGLGVGYRTGERAPSIPAYVRAILRGREGAGDQLLIEPGRSLFAAAGCLLTRVLYVKTSGRSRYVIVDAASNDLMRPALYGAWHDIVPVTRRRGPVHTYDIAGPICESGDVLGRVRRLSDPRPGDLLAILTTGAYGMSLASNYNSRGRAAEVGITGRRTMVLRRRETIADQLATEAG